MQVLRKLLFPISLVYALVVFLRNLFYDLGIFSSKSFNTPTICVGNLSVGGTGKTPMIELLVRSLKDDYSIAVLSRGYKRKSKGFILADASTTVTQIGDEPFQIKSKFPNIHIAVDADRCNGISEIEKQVAPNLILLDDAFQHRSVTPVYTILLTAYDNLYSDDWYLPTGNLRDSKDASKRAQLIIVTKCPRNLDEISQIAIIKKLNPQPHQKVLFSYLSYLQVLKGKRNSIKFDELKTKNVTLVTGIANTLPLEAYLKGKGLQFDHLKFDDHHFFSPKEIENIKEKEFVLTTEKDFVRLKNDIPKLYYIEISHEFLGDGKSVLDGALQELMLHHS